MATVLVSENEQNNTVRIEIKGRFDFGTHKEFRSAYKDRAKSGASYVIDMKGVEYIDSSALGMLLLVREHVQSYGGKLSIVGCSPDIAKILKIANFDKLFDIKLQ